MTIDDDTLLAYADGEFDDARRAEIEAAIAQDPQLAQRLEKQRALRAEIAGAFATVLDQPVPQRLLDAAQGRTAAPRGQIVQFPGRAAPATRAPWRAREWMAMAASVLLGIAVSWRFFAGGDGLMDSADGALVARGDLAIALERQLASDQARDGEVLIGLTFQDREGAWCRSFVVRASRTAGLACRAGDEWRIPVTTAAEAPSGGVAQAAGAIPPAVLGAIEARIVGEPLDAQGEEAARLGGWRR